MDEKQQTNTYLEEMKKEISFFDDGTINASFWDVLIAVTMRDSGVTRLYTENETDFRKIPWVEVLNPLRSPIRDVMPRTD